MDYVQELIERYPALNGVESALRQAIDELVTCFYSGGKLLVCGNGGSCCDADHIVGELMKGFLKKRPLDAELRQRLTDAGGEAGAALAGKLQGGLPAINLMAHAGLNSAFANDVDASMLYAQQVMGYGRQGDVLIGISTSGNAQNVCSAAIAAKALGMKTIALTGASGGRLKALVDIAVCVPETETFKVQELHLPVYHALCAAVEAEFFDE